MLRAFLTKAGLSLISVSTGRLPVRHSLNCGCETLQALRALLGTLHCLGPVPGSPSVCIREYVRAPSTLVCVCVCVGAAKDKTAGLRVSLLFSERTDKGAKRPREQKRHPESQHLACARLCMLLCVQVCARETETAPQDVRCLSDSGRDTSLKQTMICVFVSTTLFLLPRRLSEVQRPRREGREINCRSQTYSPAFNDVKQLNLLRRPSTFHGSRAKNDQIRQVY